MRELSDKELIISYLKGDEKSIEFLIDRYLKPIYSFVFRFIGDSTEAEDITQEVFVRMWKNIKKYDQERSFKTWIFSIAKNASIDFLKKKKAIPFSKFENEEGENSLIDKLIVSNPLPSEIFEQNNIGSMLSSALKELLPKDRMILFLRYNDHFTFKEIAESLGEPLNTIKSRHRRALIRLKKLLI